jgi:hypothetical protein
VWPPSHSASFSKLRSKGGFIVSARWDNASRTVADVSIEATVLPGGCTLLNPWDEASINNITVTCDGKAVAVSRRDRWIFFTPTGVGVACEVRGC